ncbi:hypothetical protein HYR99_40975 [Candidatus Poribacteria bacterium]|nr:hypothetical protein [Candidatus Poribacteria bacterium]
MATSTKSTKKRKEPIMSPAIKPGTYGEYLWNLPDEEIDRMLVEAGFNLAEIKRILAQGGGEISFPVNNAQNKSIKEKA